MLGRVFSFAVFFVVAAALLYGVYKLTGADEFSQIFRGSFSYRGPFSGYVSTSSGGAPAKEFAAPQGGTSAAQPSSQPPQQQLQPATVYAPPPAQNQPTPPYGFSVEQLSPYYKKIRISSVSPRSTWSWGSGSGGQFTLYGDSSLEGRIDITNWKLKVNSGREAYIPQAVNDYDLQGLLAQSDITLGSGEYLYAYSGGSKFGKNLRLNKCTGYLNGIYTPEPSLPNNCPRPDRNEFATFSGRCQSFIFSLGSCEIPTPQELNSFSAPNDLGCRHILDTLNYGGCYRRYRGDGDFFSREWRVWLNAEMPFDTQHDRVLLLDGQGLLVDVYTY